MRRFNFRLLVALITFGIGVLVTSLLIYTFSETKTSPANLQELNLSPNEAQQNTNQTVSEASDKVQNLRLPIPPKKQRTGNLTRIFPAVNGKSVKVTIESYSPIGKFLTDKPTDSIRINKSLGLCQIDGIMEYKVKNKIFGFQLIAHRAGLSEQERDHWKGMPFISPIFIDTDGDGVFESGSKLEVPLWALQ